ncbi:hypothetical protein FQY79_10215 [Luteimonas wenzhouensis]|uniref:Uncharacterized protein n=1 Tax=Luteimonas wenzhouensis TaxID=2599615 RepID=A0A5C5TYR7_9GAMM|nr:hypothetical protein FQY79_10215 [Luteimonas wenzhouensis]
MRCWHRWHTASCGLTNHSSRHRFAARLNSGVRRAPGHGGSLEELCKVLQNNRRRCSDSRACCRL